MSEKEVRMQNHDGDIYTQAQHEKEMTRLEIQCKRWFIAFLIVLCMLFGTNLAWVIYENSFQDVVVTQDGYVEGSGANYLNGTGEMTYGGSQSQTDNQNPGEAGQ